MTFSLTKNKRLQSLFKSTNTSITKLDLSSIWEIFDLYR